MFVCGGCPSQASLYFARKKRAPVSETACNPTLVTTVDGRTPFRTTVQKPWKHHSLVKRRATMVSPGFQWCETDSVHPQYVGVISTEISRSSLCRAPWIFFSKVAIYCWFPLNLPCNIPLFHSASDLWLALARSQSAASLESRSFIASPRVCNSYPLSSRLQTVQEEHPLHGLKRV